MTLSQTKLTTARGGAGFSMIDVLVAILVLATALLALATLQGAMTRNAADGRARSQIAAYTDGIVDQLRLSGYDPIATTTITPRTACTGTLTTAQTMACEANTAQTAAGVSSLSTAVTVTPYYGVGGAFQTTAPASLSGVAFYKQIDVSTSWVDSSGEARTLKLDTIVSPVTLDTSNNALVTKQLTISTSTSPIVREADPGTTAGVIPIAISSSANAAATNPAPVVTKTGTTFSVLNYQSTASVFGGNVFNQRVDTKIIQCHCKFGGAFSTDTGIAGVFATPNRPTYWDGTQYTTPKASTASRTTGIDPAYPTEDNTQDADCDICCRDRNDTSTDTVKYDNYSGDYNSSNNLRHYQYVAGVLTEAASGTYVNACRMIRVGGVYAAATDIRNYFFGILDTESCATAGTANSPSGCTSSTNESSAVPTATAETGYQSFVKDYLFASLSSLSGGSGPYVASTDPLGTDSAATLYDSTYGLNTPSPIQIATTNDTRYLHARGLLIDHLESSALTALSNAITNCTSTTVEATVNNCALPVLPFTTVNMTELAVWSASAPNLIVAPLNTAVGGIGSSPARGYVSAFSSTASGTVNDIATVNQLNSGLTGITSQSAISPYDNTNNLLDQKQFTVGTGSGSGSGSGNSVYFDVALSGLSWMASQSNVSLDPSVAWSGTPAQLGGSGVSSSNTASFQTGSSGSYAVTYAGSSTLTVTPTGCTKKCTTTTTYNPIAVSPTAPIVKPVGVTITVSNFNNYDNSGAQSSLICAASASGGTTTGTYSSSTGALRCHNYDVNAVTINGTAVTVATPPLQSGTTDGANSASGSTSEGRVITIPASPGISSIINTTTGADQVSIGFTEQANFPKTISGTCQCSNKSCSQKTYTAALPTVCPGP